MPDDESDIMNYGGSTHTVQTPYCEKTHWKGNSACQQHENPDRIELKGRAGGWPTIDFKMPEQRYELDKVERMMRAAYERGAADNRKAIGDTLKALIAI